MNLGSRRGKWLARSLATALATVLAAVLLLAACADTAPVEHADSAEGPGREDRRVGDTGGDGVNDAPTTDRGGADSDLPFSPTTLRVAGTVIAGGGSAHGDRYRLVGRIAAPPTPTQIRGQRFTLVVGTDSIATGGRR